MTKLSLHSPAARQKYSKIIDYLSKTDKYNNYSVNGHGNLLLLLSVIRKRKTDY